jgi:hypothetical protein
MKHIRSVPVPNWVKAAVDRRTTTAHIESGQLFRCVTKYGTVWGTGITEKVIWHVVRKFATRSNLGNISRELEQIQFLLGHVSVQTTGQYLGCKQRFRSAVNHRIGLEPDDR